MTTTISLRSVTMGDGTSYPFDESAPEYFGWDDLRISDTPRPQAHGVFSDTPDYLGLKYLTFPFVLPDTAATLHEQVAVAWLPAESNVELTITTPTRVWLAYGKPRGLRAGTHRYLPQGIMRTIGRFEMTDPRLYEDTQIGGTTGLGETTGGLGFPHGFPHGFGSATPGVIAIDNTGNFPAPWTAVVTAGVGGLANPMITLDTGERIEIAISLTEGQTLEIDQLAHEVLLNGIASRSGNVSRPASTWFELPVGESQVSFGGSGEGTLDLLARPTWLL